MRSRVGVGREALESFGALRLEVNRLLRLREEVMRLRREVVWLREENEGYREQMELVDEKLRGWSE